jgi:hypothetical protein
LESERRKPFAEIEQQLAASLSLAETELVAARIREALEATPSDPTLLRLQSQTEGRLREQQAARLVDETVERCRSSLEAAPLEALETVRKALAEVPSDLPGNDRLVALERELQERIARLSAEETRTAILLRARDALNQRNFAVAVRVLEQCQGRLRTAEIDRLLAYAREESRQEAQRQLVAASYAQAQTLLLDQRFQEVVALLAPVLQQTDDAHLRDLLEQAQSALDRRRAEQASALATVRPLAAAGFHEQVVAAVQALPPNPRASPEIQALQAASQQTWTQEWARLEALGQAYVTLASADPESISLAEPDPADSPLLAAMFGLFSARRTAVVDRLLAAQAELVQAARATGAETAAAALLASGSRLLPFASAPSAAAWSQLAGQSSSPRKIDKLLALLLGRRRS